MTTSTNITPPSEDCQTMLSPSDISYLQSTQPELFNAVNEARKVRQQRLENCDKEYAAELQKLQDRLTDEDTDLKCKFIDKRQRLVAELHLDMKKPLGRKHDTSTRTATAWLMDKVNAKQQDNRNRARYRSRLLFVERYEIEPERQRLAEQHTKSRYEIEVDFEVSLLDAESDFRTEPDVKNDPEEVAGLATKLCIVNKSLDVLVTLHGNP
ncbi:hypothetical protein PMZ80_001126 [Knufia obscura]|uniref:Uncharacterized protein n=2 Tax=Knufia TaxID=430999 RepID=A0AAN8EM75_9EURO|nr:hypothetical protein PMZ80_001126 [Knufia obscura]KAK5958809.1 hypothetical protein OHC33_000652 [Knufia fluminis]